MLVRIWSYWNSHALLVGVLICATTLEKHLAVSAKAEYMYTPWLLGKYLLEVCTLQQKDNTLQTCVEIYHKRKNNNKKNLNILGYKGIFTKYQWININRFSNRFSDRNAIKTEFKKER